MSVLLSGPRITPDAAIEAESPPTLLARRRRGDWLLFVAIFITMVLAVPPLTWLGTTNGFGLVIGVAVALAAAVAVVRKPEIGLFLVLACVVLVEENPLTIPDGTDRLNIFYWPERIAGLPERPIGFLFLFIIFMFASQRFVRWQQALRGGELLAPLVLFLGAVLIGVVHGITSGGDFKIIVLEIRPFWYLFVGYLLAYNTVTRREHVSAFIWIVILGAGVKALQGTYITFVVLHGDLAGYNEIMSHEESFFWVALLLLIFLFALHHRQRGQLIAALALVPFTGISLVANNRRADYVALLVAILVAWVLLIAIRPGRRARLVTGLVVCVVLGTAYVAAFSHSGGAFAQPARAIISTIHPDTSDVRNYSSNLYRQIENADLKFTIKQSPIIGYGFGKPFLQPVLLPNILELDPYYLFVPHNTIYWVWMRLGFLGFVALWYIFGSIIVRGCQIARRLRDPYLQLVAVYVVAITFMEVILAYADYQLFFYRNVIYLGLLCGLLLNLPKLDREDAQKDAQKDAEKESPAL